MPFYHQRVLESLDAETAASLDENDLADVVPQLLRQLETATDAPSIAGVHRALARRIVDETRGLGPLGPLLRDPDISDILVNGMHSVYIEKHGVLSRIDVRFRDFDHLTRLAQRIVEGVGRRVDELSPMCDARLEDGSRVNIIVPPLAIDGAAISIRRFRQGGFSLADLARGGAMHPGMVTMLELAARAKLNVVVSGGTGAGKTTILNALSGMIGEEARIVTLEDAAELKLQQPHVVRLESRAPSAEGGGEISMRDLLKNALRMRPDHIVVGEVRGAEALEAMQAMNTGHPGSMVTVHANSPRDAISMPWIQFRAVFPSRHRGLFASNVAWAAFRKVGVLARLFSANGSRPLATARRFAMARSRALAKEISGKPPKPMSWRLPSMVIRWTQDLDPRCAIMRNKVSPSA